MGKCLHFKVKNQNIHVSDIVSNFTLFKNWNAIIYIVDLQKSVCKPYLVIDICKKNNVVYFIVQAEKDIPQDQYHPYSIQDVLQELAERKYKKNDIVRIRKEANSTLYDLILCPLSQDLQPINAEERCFFFMA